MSSRKAQFNVERTFFRGEVYWVTLPAEPPLDPDDSYVMNGRHRVVVLYDSTFPRKTVPAIPISSLYGNDGIKKETIDTDLILRSKDYDAAKAPYKGTIKKESFVKTEQLRPFTRHWLEEKAGELLPEDMINLDFRLIATFHLQETINEMIESEVQKRIAALAEQLEEEAN